MTARILIIAGSDSGGGAGIQADIKTVTMLGGHAMTAVTAITAQNTLGVQAVHPVPTDMVVAQIDAIARDIGVDAVKIGMIGSAATAKAIVKKLKHLDLGAPVVFDPVMVATSGSILANAETIAAFHAVMEISMLLTPNLPELEALGGEAAMTGLTLVKGGHAEGNVIIDRLIGPMGEFERWEGDRIETSSTHGTGCTLASAIATGLGQGMSLVAAIARARQFVRAALYAAPGLGSGHGPLGHQAVRDVWDDEEFLPSLSLNQVTVNSSDYAGSVAFYKTLGLRLIVDSPDNGYARFEAPNGATLSIHHDAGHGVSGTTVYFECPDLDARVTALKAAGLVFASDPVDQSWLWREAELFDPFGNRILLYSAGENRRYPPWRIK